MTRLDDVDLKQAEIAYAALDFFAYCNLKSPKFYKEDRDFLISVCVMIFKTFMNQMMKMFWF